MACAYTGSPAGERPRLAAGTLRQRARVLACNDLDILGGWITGAVSTASTRELLGDDKASPSRRTGQRVPPKRAKARGAAAKK